MPTTLHPRIQRVRTHVPASLRVQKKAPGKIFRPRRETNELAYDWDDKLTGYTRITKGKNGSRDTVQRRYLTDERGWNIAEMEPTNNGQWKSTKLWIYLGNYAIADSSEKGWTWYGRIGEQPIGHANVDTQGHLSGRWYLTDHLGSVTRVENDTGGAVQNISLDPYGNMESMDGSETVSLTYTGKPRDGLVDATNHGARLLDNRLGMWMGRDPLLQYHSAYLYLGSNPLRGIDPDGLSALVNTSGTVTYVNDDGFNDVSVTLQYNGKEVAVPIATSQEKLSIGDQVCLNYQKTPEYQSSLDRGTTNNSGYSNWIWAGSQSLQNGYMDYQGSENMLPDNYSHFMINSTIYERAKAGNYMWGRSMALLGFSYATARVSAEMNAFMNAKMQNPGLFGTDINMWNRWTLPSVANDGTFGSDNPYDRAAIKSGFYGQ